MGRAARQAIVHRVAKSLTGLKQLSMHALRTDVHTAGIRIETHVPQCSLKHCLQWLGHGSNLDIHTQMNG